MLSDSLNNSHHQLLLVDDNPMNLDTLLPALGDRYDLRVAVNGQAALDLMASGYRTSGHHHR